MSHTLTDYNFEILIREQHDKVIFLQTLYLHLSRYVSIAFNKNVICATYSFYISAGLKAGGEGGFQYK